MIDDARHYREQKALVGKGGVSSGVLLTLPDNGTKWCVLLWGSIGVAWGALIVGFVLQRKFVAGVRTGSRLAKWDGKRE